MKLPTANRQPPTANRFSPGDPVTIYRPYQRRWIPARFVSYGEESILLKVRAEDARHDEYVHPKSIRDARQESLDL